MVGLLALVDRVGQNKELLRLLSLSGGFRILLGTCSHSTGRIPGIIFKAVLGFVTQVVR